MITPIRLTPEMAIHNAIERGVEVEIVVGPDMDKSTTAIGHLASEGKLSLYQLADPPKYGFMVVDGKHARIMELYSSFERGYVLFNTLILASKLESDFASIRDRARKYQDEPEDGRIG